MHWRLILYFLIPSITGSCLEDEPPHPINQRPPRRSPMDAPSAQPIDDGFIMTPGGRKIVPGQLMVLLRKDADIESVKTMLQASGVRILFVMEEIRIITLEIKSKKFHYLLLAKKRIDAIPGVEGSTFNFYMGKLTFPTRKMDYH